MSMHLPLRLAPLTLLLLLVAGCAHPAANSMASTSLAPLPSLALGNYTTSPALPMAKQPQFSVTGMPDVGGGEPNIAMLPDGTMFITSPAGGAQKPNVRDGSAFLWRSTDGGHAWTTLRNPNLAKQTEGGTVPGGFCSCDADVVTSADGWTYYADWWIAGFAGPGNYIVEASPDAGKTWTSSSITIPENLVASMDREWLVAGPDGYVALLYSFFGSTPSPVTPPVPVFGLDRPAGTIEAVYSHDHGASWSTPTLVQRATDPNDALLIGHPFLAPNGTLMMPYGLVHGTTAGGFWYDDSEVRLSYSMDKGATWKDTRVARAPLGFDNLWSVQGAVDASTGETTIVWAARDTGVKAGKVAANSTMGLWVKQFGPLGSSEPVLVRGTGQNFLPWATARDGQAAVGWYGGNATGDMTKAPADATWYAYTAIAPNGLFTHGSTVALVSGEPVKTGPFCPKGSACSGNRELLDYVSLILDGKGLVHYAFTRSEGGKPHVAVGNQDP